MLFYLLLSKTNVTLFSVKSVTTVYTRAPCEGQSRVRSSNDARGKIPASVLRTNPSKTGYFLCSCNEARVHATIYFLLLSRLLQRRLAFLQVFFQNKRWFLERGQKSCFGLPVLLNRHRWPNPKSSF